MLGYLVNCLTLVVGVVTLIFVIRGNAYMKRQTEIQESAHRASAAATEVDSLELWTLRTAAVKSITMMFWPGSVPNLNPFYQVGGPISGTPSDSELNEWLRVAIGGLHSKGLVLLKGINKPYEVTDAGREVIRANKAQVVAEPEIVRFDPNKPPRAEVTRLSQ